MGLTRVDGNNTAFLLAMCDLFCKIEFRKVFLGTHFLDFVQIAETQPALNVVSSPLV